MFCLKQGNKKIDVNLYFYLWKKKKIVIRLLSIFSTEKSVFEVFLNKTAMKYM